jgi:hypothetical protein
VALATWKKGLTTSVVAVVLLVVAALILGSTMAVTSSPEAQADGDTNVNVVIAEASCDVTVAARLAVESTGFKRSEYVIGEGNFDLLLPGANDAGSGVFAEKPIQSKDELVEFLNSDSDAANEAVESVAKNTGEDVSVVKKSSERWVGVQYTVPSNWSGNTTYTGGSTVQVAATRDSQKGDIAWVFVPEAACKVVKANTNNKGKVEVTKVVKTKVAQTVGWMRGPCGNPQTVPPHPNGHNPPNPPGDDKPCVKPPKPGDGEYNYNPNNCTWHKPGQSWQDQQNGDTGVRQDPQHNPCCNTGPTTDGDGNPVPEPDKPPKGPDPCDDCEAPDSNDGGYDSGSDDGSGTPGGSTSDGDGTSTGDNDTSDPDDSGQGGDTGDNDTDPGGF